MRGARETKGTRSRGAQRDLGRNARKNIGNLTNLSLPSSRVEGVGGMKKVEKYWQIPRGNKKSERVQAKNGERVRERERERRMSLVRRLEDYEDCDVGHLRMREDGRGV